MADPTWYMMKRVEAGLAPGNGLSGLIATKIITTIILVVAAW
jgi:hypothetical protein